MLADSHVIPDPFEGRYKFFQGHYKCFKEKYKESKDLLKIAERKHKLDTVIRRNNDDY